MWEKLLEKIMHQDIVNLSALETGAEPIYVYTLQHLALFALVPFALFVAYRRFSFLRKIQRGKIEKICTERNIPLPLATPFTPVFTYVVMNFIVNFNGSTVFNMILTAVVILFVVRREERRYSKMLKMFG